MGQMAHARAMKILEPSLRFVARASRRAASTVVSTFFSAVTAIRLEVQRAINAFVFIRLVNKLQSPVSRQGLQPRPVRAGFRRSH